MRSKLSDMLQGFGNTLETPIRRRLPEQQEAPRHYGVSRRSSRWRLAIGLLRT
jgi:hypothetical protein